MSVANYGICSQDILLLHLFFMFPSGFFLNQSLLVSVKGGDRSTMNLYVVQASHVSVVTLQVEQRALSHAVAASRACGGDFGMVLL